MFSIEAFGCMHIRFPLFAFSSFLFLFGSCGNKDVHLTEYTQADSLNALSYSMRYKSLAESSRLAAEAYRFAGRDEDARAEALNNLAFCAFMKMDFEHSSHLFERALSEGNNEIDHLISDIGLMKIYQRTSQNKLFYDYRNSAQKRMQRIHEDATLITDAHEKKLFRYAVSEFYIVSGIYFYYLQQHKESIASIDAIQEESLRTDTAQWLYYKYMRGSGGMYQASNYEKVLEGELGYLVDCLMQSKEKGYIYFEANALQGIAEILNLPRNRNLLKEDKQGLLRLINDKNLPIDSLPLYCARKALYLFQEYGDWYQSSGTYRTIATYYNFSNRPQKALENLREGLQYVNKHHEKYYHCLDSTDRLFTYVPQSNYSRELKWITADGIKTIPEWILRLREQLSRTYAAMGCKQESDYNRNVYLDLLDYTRQDKSVESRFVRLAEESKQLNTLLLLVMGSLCLLVSLFIVLNKRWRKRNQAYMNKVRQVFSLCQKIIASIPSKAVGSDELVEAVLSAISTEFNQIFGISHIRIVLRDNTHEDVVATPESKDGEKINLLFPGTNEVVGWLWILPERPLSKDESYLLQLVWPYLAWALGKGMLGVLLEDEKNRLEKERYVHMQHLQDNKKQNIAKKACVSVVTGILPYIDRMVHEVQRLKSVPQELGSEVGVQRVKYIEELIAHINEYNEILSLWIRMRKGALSLNIETFSLNELFEIVAKGKQSFEIKHQHFSVSATETKVKADKALTLFMINTLTENARKYTQSGGHVFLSATEGKDYIEISVSDDGPGLSEADIKCILNEKVYDSEKIGVDTARNLTELRKKKGFGFGLMNCKGIIDKYRKTSEIFAVCKFDVQSVPGKGCRFCFRLPKGIGKGLAVLCFGLFMGGCMVGSGNKPLNRLHDEQSDSVGEASYDSLLAIADNYANRVYTCNVQADYHRALSLADSALHYMNAHYLCYSGRRTPLLKMYEEDNEAAEQQWLSQKFDTDYYILLDVRNEIAVAALAIKDFKLYSYNNQAYAVLYKQISKDRTLEAYCEQMQQSFNNKMIASVLLLLLVLAAAIAYYMLYVRRRQHYRYSMEQVFAINEAMFSATSSLIDLEDESPGMPFLDALYPELNELVAIADMALGVYDEESHSMRYFFYAKGKERADLEAVMQHCLEKRKSIWQAGNDWSCFFLSVRVGEETRPVGVLAIEKERWQDREEDRLLVEWVMGYLSAVLYTVVIKAHRQYMDIELAQDEARRTQFEENALHVQNMVLDNCLSTIKHETLYYPSRIKNIIDTLQNEGGVADETEKTERLNAISELVAYYRDIFAMLTSCALRQLDGKTFRREEVPVGMLLRHAVKHFRKEMRKCSCALAMELSDKGDEDDVMLIGDKTLLSFLLENLINEAIRYHQPGVIALSWQTIDGFVRFDFTDKRRSHMQTELNELFYPSLKWMQPDKHADFIGTEFLLCKQIIREHDENLGHCGCRINASVCEGGGYSIWFTIPRRRRD